MHMIIIHTSIIIYELNSTAVVVVQYSSVIFYSCGLVSKARRGGARTLDVFLGERDIIIVEQLCPTTTWT